MHTFICIYESYRLKTSLALLTLHNAWSKITKKAYAAHLYRLSAACVTFRSSYTSKKLAALAHTQTSALSRRHLLSRSLSYSLALLTIDKQHSFDSSTALLSVISNNNTPWWLKLVLAVVVVILFRAAEVDRARLSLLSSRVLIAIKRSTKAQVSSQSAASASAWVCVPVCASNTN